MADLNVTAAGVLAANSNTVIATGYSGTVISAGQVLWLNGTANPPVLAPASGSFQVQAANVAGIALDSAAAANQLISYAVSGSVILPTSGVGSVLTNGSAYVLSSGTAGNLIAANDSTLQTGNYITFVGMAVNPTTLLVNIAPVAAIH